MYHLFSIYRKNVFPSVVDEGEYSKQQIWTELNFNLMANVREMIIYFIACRCEHFSSHFAFCNSPV